MQELPSGPGSVASNRLALGALALVVAGVTQLPSGILRAGVVSASARNLEVALGANSTAFRLGVALANGVSLFRRPTIPGASQDVEGGTFALGGVGRMGSRVRTSHWGGGTGSSASAIGVPSASRPRITVGSRISPLLIAVGHHPANQPPSRVV